MKTNKITLPTILIGIIFLAGSCTDINEENKITEDMDIVPSLTIDQAYRLSLLPLHCLQTEYPNKTGIVLGSDDDLKSPRILRPAFYGCFDWHSAVHGHWTLVNIIKNFDEIKNKDEILHLISQQLSAENILIEKDFFLHPHNTTFERTYGWAWLLKLAEELYLWENELSDQLYENLLPLTQVIVQGYLDYLPKLVYPIRTGEHSNTAFGLKLARDFASSTGQEDLLEIIDRKAKEFYANDQSCPLNYEPGGHDFLSPCLEEADLMRSILEKEDFKKWLNAFLPEIQNTSFHLEPGRILDRTDGKLVHLDGLNFSRAGILYGIGHAHPEYSHLLALADEHIHYSLPNLTDDHYEGGHWLATFALYALGRANKN